jgi:hypothetical protein
VKTHSRLSAVCLLLAGGSFTYAFADIASSITSGNSPSNPGFYWGEAITTIVGGPWDALSFNFYSGSSPSTPLAEGDVFLLSEPYLGTPAALSSSTPGFVAEGAASGEEYDFTANVTITGDTEYWIYTDTVLPSLMGGAINPSYDFYYAPSDTVDFSNISGSGVDYSLMGTPATVTPVPEPGFLGVLAIDMVGLLCAARRRRSNR